MRGQKSLLPVQFPTFLPEYLHAHALLMSGRTQSVTRTKEENRNIGFRRVANAREPRRKAEAINAAI